MQTFDQGVFLESLTKNVEKSAQLLSNYNQCLALIGSNQDTEAFREQIALLRAKLKKQFDVTQKQFHSKYSQQITDRALDKILYQKLSRTFAEHKLSFEHQELFTQRKLEVFPPKANSQRNVLPLPSHLFAEESLDELFAHINNARDDSKPFSGSGASALSGVVTLNYSPETLADLELGLKDLSLDDQNPASGSGKNTDSIAHQFLSKKTKKILIYTAGTLTGIVVAGSLGATLVLFAPIAIPLKVGAIGVASVAAVAGSSGVSYKAAHSLDKSEPGTLATDTSSHASSSCDSPSQERKPASDIPVKSDAEQSANSHPAHKKFHLPSVFHKLF